MTWQMHEKNINAWPGSMETSNDVHLERYLFEHIFYKVSLNSIYLHNLKSFQIYDKYVLVVKYILVEQR